MERAHNGTVFLITPYSLRPELMTKYFPKSVISQFISAMEPRFHIVQQVTYPSNVNDESVMVFRESPQGKH